MGETTLGGRTAPLKLTVETDPTGMEPGEYEAQITVTVPAAFYPELKIPVKLTVLAPPE